MFLKGMVESSLLFKDERLTPNIDEVMPVRNLRKRAQITKISDFLRGVCTLNDLYSRYDCS